MNIQSPIEERWNWITHGIGLILSAIGFCGLIICNTHQTEYSIFSIVLYSSSLIVLYFASTAYHYSSEVKLKRRFRIMDHVGIYLLIAGTYSPITLITLLDSKGVTLFFVVWSIVIIGSLLKLFFTGRFQVLSIFLYLIMGWLIIFDSTAFMAKVDPEGINYLILGGVSYTVGIVFYAMKKLPFGHVIWHLFVLAGSIFHYLLIFKHVI